MYIGIYIYMYCISIVPYDMQCLGYKRLHKLVRIAALSLSLSLLSPPVSHYISRIIYIGNLIYLYLSL